jgi:hypothetical protein
LGASACAATGHTRSMSARIRIALSLGTKP